MRKCHPYAFLVGASAAGIARNSLVEKSVKDVEKRGGKEYVLQCHRTDKKSPPGGNDNACLQAYKVLARALLDELHFQGKICPSICVLSPCQNNEERRAFVVKLVIRDKESIQEAVRRFRKLIERSGLKKEMRRREHFEKPSEVKRRAKLRAIHRSQYLLRQAKEGSK